MRVVVTGMVATYPLGGVAWDYFQYLLGFHALGCEVLYLEDTGRWVYDRAAQTFTADVSGNARWVGESLTSLEPALGDAWAVRGEDGTWHGWSEAEVHGWCRTADLFLNVSGSSWLRDEYRQARVVAYVDTDPAYSQAHLLAGGREADLMRAHDVFFSTGLNVGTPASTIPDCGLRWYPTRPPVALDRWPVGETTRAPFTTVMSWVVDGKPPVLGGVAYGGKDVEFARFAELPRMTAVPLELAISGKAPRPQLMEQGWAVREAGEVSGTVDAYRSYLATSRGEWSVAKNAYVATRSGWFSTRSAAYLACGRPVVVQETGFSDHLPVGPGLHGFSTPEEAVIALDAVERDYDAASRHARAVAEEAFDARRVCHALLRDAGVA